MPDDALLWNASPPASRPRRPAAHLWTMRRGNDVADFVLLGHGEYGWEWQVRFGGFSYGRLCTLRAEAIACASDERRAREHGGWCVGVERSYA